MLTGGAWRSSTSVSGSSSSCVSSFKALGGSLSRLGSVSCSLRSSLQSKNSRRPSSLMAAVVLSCGETSCRSSSAPGGKRHRGLSSFSRCRRIGSLQTTSSMLYVTIFTQISARQRLCRPEPTVPEFEAIAPPSEPAVTAPFYLELASAARISDIIEACPVIRTRRRYFDGRGREKRTSRPWIYRCHRLPGRLCLWRSSSIDWLCVIRSTGCSPSDTSR